MERWISDEVFGEDGLWPSRKAFEAEIRHLTDSTRVEWIAGKAVAYPPRPSIDGPLAFAASFHIDTYLQNRPIGMTFRPAPAFCLRKTPARLIRIPDVGFICAHRLAQMKIGPICMFAPDLIIEVLSEQSRLPEIDNRIQDFFAAGTSMAWIIDFTNRTCEVRERSGDKRVFTESEKVYTAPLLPRLNLRVSQFFEMFE